MSDDEDESQCPLCVEEMDLSDKNFLPCPCGYRVCMWCWHHIRENLNGLCPACRTPYNADPHAFSAVDRQEIVKKNRERKQKERHEKKVIDRPSALVVQANSKPVSASVSDRRHLHNYRVVQRNLVYVIGVPTSLANEELLRKPEYFGQYGKIGKVVIHRNLSSTHATASAYVTFVYKDDAKASIQSLDGFWLDGHVLRASFGTTKYCNNFIRGVPCNNPECVYLHDLGDDDDRFTKEEIQSGHSKLAQIPGKDQTIVTGNGGPSGTGKRPIGDPVLPPPVFIQDNISLISAGTRPVNKNPNWSAISEVPNVTTELQVALKSSDSKVSESVVQEIFQEKNEIVVEAMKIDEDSESTNNNCGHTLITEHGISVLKASLSDEPSTVVDVGMMRKSPTESLQSAVHFKQDDFDTEFASSSICSKDTLLSNGITSNAVFPVPCSSFTVSVWAPIMHISRKDLNIDPYSTYKLPLSELLDLTLPPVDAMCMSPWPRPLMYYSQKKDPPISSSGGEYSQKRMQTDQPGEGSWQNRSIKAEKESLETRKKLHSVSATSEKSSTSIVALRQLFPSVNMSVGPPAFGGSGS